MRIALVGLGRMLAACSKELPGDYTGTLSETCSITQTSDVRAAPSGLVGTVTSCGGGGVKAGFVLHVAKRAAKDKLEIDLEGCKIALSERDSRASVDPDQTCTLNVTGYEGKTTVDGTLSKLADDNGIQLTIDFLAAE